MFCDSTTSPDGSTMTYASFFAPQQIPQQKEEEENMFDLCTLHILLSSRPQL
jgi:hypothetical protein